MAMAACNAIAHCTEHSYSPLAWLYVAFDVGTACQHETRHIK